MKKISLIIWLLCLFPLYAVAAQAPGSDLQSMRVSFWPDFDQPSVLVLMTGEMPAQTIFPAAVSLPIPDGAQINAVANVTEDGMLSIDYEASDSEISFVVNQPQFRVEYYDAYQLDGRTRSYDFEWLADVSVAEFEAEVQQPASGSNMRTEPPAADVSTGQFDGLAYYGLDAQAVPGGTTYQLSFSYDMATDDLTVAAAEPDSAQTAEALPPTSESSSEWLLYAAIAGLVVLAVVGTWLFATRNQRKKSARPRKPAPKRTAQSSKGAVYCHNCGQKAEGQDRFCRNCGTELKQV